MKIIDILRELTALPSVSDTEHEKSAGDKIYEMLSQIPYFKERGEFLGKHACPDDRLGREVIWGLVKGSEPKAVVLMSHYDVVGVDDYGNIKEFAFDIDRLPEKLKNVRMDADAVKDLESGEWIFGRGTADMKAGIAVDIWLMDELSKADLSGNVVFLAVPDEESYSVGMRAASRFLLDLKTKHGLDYELCIVSEPNRRSEGKHIMSLGTAGKCMPAVLVQGEKAHVSMCFDGLNPLGILADIFRGTELGLDFSDEFDGSRTMPPSWNYLRDMKYEYDVSLPIRAGGYFSVVSYYSTPDETLAKLRKICRECFDGYVNHMKEVYERFKQGQKHIADKTFDYETTVMTFGELTKHCEKMDGFKAFTKELYAETKQKLDAGLINLPAATLEMMARVLDFSGITKPLVLIGFAPPYYAPFRSNNVKGKENKASEYFEYARGESFRLFGTEAVSEEYTGLMTDMSYLAPSESFDHADFSANTPLWGEIYQIDFDAIRQINIPGILLGPWGKDLHQASERVYRHDAEVRLPALKKMLIGYVL